MKYEMRLVSENEEVIDEIVGHDYESMKNQMDEWLDPAFAKAGNKITIILE